MPIALHQLPDDVDALKSLLTKEAARNEQLTTENQGYEVQVLTLTEQLNLALARRYAASSEKLSLDQISLFDEAVLDSEVLDTVVDASSDDEGITVAAHQRKKCGRKPLPDHLRRVDVIHELAEDDCRCEHDGQLLAEIGEVISEQLDIIPAKIQVTRHIHKNELATARVFYSFVTRLPGSTI